MIKKILIVLAGVLLILQFFRPERNLSDDRTYDIATRYTVPAKIEGLLQGACNDCHTNKTTYPWYANVQPVAWWLSEHVNDGKRHLNFSAFTNLSVARQNHKFEEIVEVINKKEMPLPSYTWLGLHPGAILSEEDGLLIADWAKAQMDTLKKNYPPDSLVLKRRRG